MIENIEILRDIETELARFTKKIKTAIKEQGHEDSRWMHKEFASAKRGAMDLKRELTKLTQSSKYKYGRE